MEKIRIINQHSVWHEPEQLFQPNAFHLCLCFSLSLPSHLALFQMLRRVRASICMVPANTCVCSGVGNKAAKDIHFALAHTRIPTRSDERHKAGFNAHASTLTPSARRRLKLRFRGTQTRGHVINVVLEDEGCPGCLCAPAIVPPELYEAPKACLLHLEMLRLYLAGDLSW